MVTAGDGNIGWIKGGWTAPTAIASIDTTGNVDNTLTIRNALSGAARGAVLTLPSGTLNVRCDGTCTFGALTDVTLTSSGAGKAGLFTAGTVGSLVATGTKTSNYSAVVNDSVQCDTSAGGFTVTLPNAPADKSVVQVVQVGATSHAIPIAVQGTDTMEFGQQPGTVAAVPAGFGRTFVYSSSNGTGHGNWCLFASQSRSTMDGSLRTVFRNLSFTGSNAAPVSGGYTQLTNLYALEKGTFVGGAVLCSYVDCSWTKCGGDAVALSDDSFGNVTPQSIVFLRCSGTACGGNGMSIVRANGLLIDTYTTSGCGQLAFDFEPNGSDYSTGFGGETVFDVEIRNCDMDANRYLIGGHGLGPSGGHEVSRIYVHNTIFRSSPYCAATNPLANQTNPLQPPTNICSDWVFENNTAAVTMVAPLGASYSWWYFYYVHNLTIRGNDLSAASTNLTSSKGMVGFASCSGRIEVSGNTAASGQAAFPIQDQGGNTPNAGVIAQFSNTIGGVTYTPQVTFPPFS